MHKNHQIGIVVLIVGVVLAVWAYNRFTSLIGRLHSWEMPLNSYETYTVAAALIALLLFVVGLRKISYKPNSEDEKKE